jgi:hypothetical protein
LRIDHTGIGWERQNPLGIILLENPS